jgi:predicted nucleotidyltransferase
VDKKILSLIEKSLIVINSSGVDYMIGGGISLRYYGLKRTTKDLDVFVTKEGAERLLKEFERKGFSTKLTDIRWLYQATDGVGNEAFKKENTVDIIFNNDIDIDISKKMLKRAKEVKLKGFNLKIPALEELILFKIYSQKIPNQPHWHDAKWLINNHNFEIDWPYFLDMPEANSKYILGFLLMTDTARGSVPLWVINKLKERLL